MKLYVGGVGARGGGYPNAARTLELLRKKPRFEVVELGTWLPDDFHLWKLARLPRLKASWELSCLFFANLYSLVRVLARTRGERVPVYIPYPAIFFLFALSYVPKRWRPYCIVDSYISIWDSLFRDRATAKKENTASRFLKACESRALRTAETLLVDTDASREMFVAEFGVAPEKVKSIPLAIDEGRFSPGAARAIRERARVLFVGTLIPLHGIDVILDAFARLAEDKRLEFCLIGDGQQSILVEKFVASHPGVNLQWIREWCSLDRIASEIASADVCLGVFGGEAKAARVLPFKIYMYLAAGRAVITQPSFSSPRGCPPIPVMTATDGESLAKTIELLIGTPELCRSLDERAALYYARYLSNAAVSAAWDDLLASLTSE